MSTGRSRQLWIHLAYMWPMTVSLVGRTTSGSSSSLPPPTVTTASSGLKPSTCSASFARKLDGMKSGKYALTCPDSLNRESSASRMPSQSA